MLKQLQNQKDRGIRGAILVNKQYDPDYSISLGLSEGGQWLDLEYNTVLDDMNLDSFGYYALRHNSVFVEDYDEEEEESCA